MVEYKIGMIPGTGKQSSGIALRLGKAGYKVMIGSRSKDKAVKIASELNERLGSNQFIGFSNEEVVRQNNILFLVIPPENLKSTLDDLLPHLQPGTIIVDVIVSLAFKEGLAYNKLILNEKQENMESVSEYIQSRVPEGITVAGGFKTVSAAKLNRLTKPLSVDVFLTADDSEIKIKLKELLSKIEGLRILDAGPLRSSRTTEQMTALVININKLNKLKHASFKVISTQKK
ncbi:MAG: NADPH-dependent F420 reductase [Candidatus Heimdallarchaeota archaeon]